MVGRLDRWCISKSGSRSLVAAVEFGFGLMGARRSMGVGDCSCRTVAGAVAVLVVVVAGAGAADM